MKSILLLTDFSDSAKNAIHYAINLFESETCKFHLVHIHKAGSFISDDLMMTSQESIYESITKGPKLKMKIFVEELKNQYQNEKHTFSFIIDFDIFIDTVNQIIKQHDIDYIVMGSNGQTGAMEVIFGSNTINVLRNIHCKTIVVPSTCKFKPIVNFLFPLQCEDVINDEQLDTINNLYKLHDFKLHVLRVCGLDNVKSKNDLNVLDPFNWIYALENHKPYFVAVFQYLEDYDIDMTGLIVHDKSFLKRLFTNSPALDLSKVIKLPLMIFHKKAN